MTAIYLVLLDYTLFYCPTLNMINSDNLYKLDGRYLAQTWRYLAQKLSKKNLKHFGEVFSLF